MDILALLAAVTVMGAIVTGLVAVYQTTASPRTDLDRRLGNILGEGIGFEATVLDRQALRQKREGLPIIGSLLDGKSWADDVAMRLERADMSLTVSEFVAIRIMLALLLVALPVTLLSGVIGYGVAVLGGLMGYTLPSLQVSRATSKRMKKIDEQLVDALSMISNALKSGFGLMQSLDLAARELQHPIATEFRRTLHDINVGSTTDEALLAMAKRCGSPDLDIVITAMLIAQSTGGNLAEILENVAHTMRERIRIRGEISTLTTQGMMTGFIIGGLPFVIGGFVSLINPGYIGVLFTTVIGNVMLGAAFMLEMFGVFLIKRILAIEV